MIINFSRDKKYKEYEYDYQPPFAYPTIVIKKLKAIDPTSLLIFHLVTVTVRDTTLTEEVKILIITSNADCSVLMV